MAFNEANVERKFKALNNTQDSIQSISLWVIHHKAHYEKIIESWFKILKKSTIPHRLTMFYLCNDVVQTCKRKHAIVYKDAFKDVLKDAVLLVRDNSIRPNIERMFKIWEERNIYDTEFMEDLIGVLENQKVRTVMNSRLLAEFQPAKVVEELHTYSKLLADVEKKHKLLPPMKVDPAALESIRLKDKTHGKEYTQQFEESCVKLDEYIILLETALKQRTSLIELLEQSELFYDSQFGEARIVANAYKNFGTRVNNLKKKLDDLKHTLPSPVTTPTMDAPSPGNTPPLDNTRAVDMEMSDDEKDAKKGEEDSPKSLGSAPSPEGSPIGLSPQRGGKVPSGSGNSGMPFTSFMTSRGGGSAGFAASSSSSASAGTDDIANTHSDIMNTLKDLSRFEELWNQGALKMDTPPQEQGASPAKDRSPQPIPTLSSSRADFSPLGNVVEGTPVADEMGEMQSSQDSDEEDETGDDGGGGTPVMDEMGKDSPEQASVSSMHPDHNAIKTNPIDFLNQLISQSSKTQPKATSTNNLLHSLGVLSRANLDEGDSDSGGSTPNSWASWKALQQQPPAPQQQQQPVSHHLTAPPPPPPHVVNTSLHQAHPLQPHMQPSTQVSPPVMPPAVQSSAHPPAFSGTLPPPVQQHTHAPPPPPPPPMLVRSEHNNMPSHLSMPPHFSQASHSQPAAAAPQTPVHNAPPSTPDTAPHMHQTQPTSAAGHTPGVMAPHHPPPMRSDAPPLMHPTQATPPPMRTDVPPPHMLQAPHTPTSLNPGPPAAPLAPPPMAPHHPPPPPVSKPPLQPPLHPPNTSIQSPPPGYQSAYSSIPPPPQPPQPPRFTPSSVRPPWQGPPPPPPPTSEAWQRQPAPTPRWSQPPPRNPSPNQWQTSPPAQSPPPRNTSPSQWQPVQMGSPPAQPNQGPQPWKMTISPRPPRPPGTTPPVKINRNSNLTELSSHGQGPNRPNLTEISPQRSNLSDVPTSRPPVHKNANLSNLTELSSPREKPRPTPLNVHVTPVSDDMRAKTAVRRGNLTPIQMVDISQQDMELDSEEEEGEITSDSDQSPVKAPSVDIQSPDRTPQGSVSPPPPLQGSVSPQQPPRPPTGPPSKPITGSKRPSQDDQLEFIEKLKRKSAPGVSMSEASPGNGPRDESASGEPKTPGRSKQSSVTTPPVDSTPKPAKDSDRAIDSESESGDASSAKARPARLDWSAPTKPTQPGDKDSALSNVAGYYSDSPYKRREVDNGDPYRREWPSDYTYVPPRNRHHSDSSSRHSHPDGPPHMPGPPVRPPGPPPYHRNKPYHGHHHHSGSHHSGGSQHHSGSHRRYNRY